MFNIELSHDLVFTSEGLDQMLGIAGQQEPHVPSMDGNKYAFLVKLGTSVKQVDLKAAEI
jgi:hypothetical protein